MKSFRAVASLILLLALGEAVYAAGGQRVSSFAREQKATLHFDVLSGTGYLEKGGAIVSFAVGIPLAVFDWEKTVRVEAPYLSGNELFLPDDLAAMAKDYFLKKNKPAQERYSVATVLIDPGHGGKDPGAVAEVEGRRLQEKDLTLEVSKRVLDLLKARYPDRNILSTRLGDTYPSLEERVAMANSVALKPNEAVIYVSIHANASFNKNAKGYEVWYLNPEYRRTVVSEDLVKEKGKDLAPILNAMLEEEFTTESIMLAKNIYERIGKEVGKSSPGRGIRAEEWFVVRNANMPSVLVEMGFITNGEEGKLLATQAYLRRIGDAIYNGIVDFIDYFER
jgi:N-acetylmuramoyl-L-alanine amidase